MDFLFPDISDSITVPIISHSKCSIFDRFNEIIELSIKCPNKMKYPKLITIPNKVWKNIDFINVHCFRFIKVKKIRCEMT